MRLDQVTRWRHGLGRAGALFCAFFLLAAIDGLLLRFTEPEHILRLFPGESAKVNGTLRDMADNVQALGYVSNSEHIQLSLEAVHAGFWLGGQMWRGKVSVSPQAKAGEYRLIVGLRDDPMRHPSSAFLVKIYTDRKSYRAASGSLLQRYLGVSPWWTSSFFFVLTFLTLAGIFGLSVRRGTLLMQQGKAEVYKAVQRDGVFEVSFGLGGVHGVEPGTLLTLLDERGNPVGKVRIETVYETDSVGLVEDGERAKPGYMVSLEH